MDGIDHLTSCDRSTFEDVRVGRSKSRFSSRWAPFTFVCLLSSEDRTAKPTSVLFHTCLKTSFLTLPDCDPKQGPRGTPVPTEGLDLYVSRREVVHLPGGLIHRARLLVSSVVTDSCGPSRRRVGGPRELDRGPVTSLLPPCFPCATFLPSSAEKNRSTTHTHHSYLIFR